MTGLLDLPEGPFQMQSWDPSAHCTCPVDQRAPDEPHKPGCPYPTATWSWEPMENGAASSHWRPKKDLHAAVRHAAGWSGAVYGMGIPAMQVVDLATGAVLWRCAVAYPDAGESIEPDWVRPLYADARRELSDDEADLPALAEPAPPADTTTQGALW